jgi:porphobilinogen synthase
MTRRSAYQPQRMRQREPLRALLREHHLSASQLVMPLFVRHGTHVRSPIPSMPGQFQLSVDQLVKECRELQGAGVAAILLFGLAERKDERGSGAWAKDGIVQQAVRAIKAQTPELLVITDVCLCAYTSHGHCGIVKTYQKSKIKHQTSGEEGGFWIDSEATLELLGKTAVSHAEAGADLVAPSDMMDGNVAAVRAALDGAAFDRIPIMAYTVKFASALYAPFRQAVESAPRFSDRRSYQMDPANAEEALREAQLDIESGADILMVKPALAYLDIIVRLKQAFPHPVAAFNVSGEYAMVKAAASRGWLAERPTWWELLLGLKRAGADILITYWAKEAVKLLRER